MTSAIETTLYGTIVFLSVDKLFRYINNWIIANQQWIEYFYNVFKKYVIYIKINKKVIDFLHIQGDWWVAYQY